MPDKTWHDHDWNNYNAILNSLNTYIEAIIFVGSKTLEKLQTG